MDTANGASELLNQKTSDYVLKEQTVLNFSVKFSEEQSANIKSATNHGFISHHFWNQIYWTNSSIHFGLPRPLITEYNLLTAIYFCVFFLLNKRWVRKLKCRRPWPIEHLDDKTKIQKNLPSTLVQGETWLFIWLEECKQDKLCL